MPSLQPQQSQASHGAARRRQRSTRLVAASAFLAAAAALVGWSLVDGGVLILSIGAVGGVVLGLAATRITHSELMTARRAAARDLARQAAEYSVIAERRSDENAAFAADLQNRISQREEAIGVLEVALSKAQRLAADQTLKLGTEARRADGAERAVAGLARSLETAEARGSESEVRIVELQAEIDVLRSEMTSLKSAAMARTTRSA